MTYSVIPIDADGHVPVQIIGKSVTDGAFVNAKMTPDGGQVINQDIRIDPTNSSTTNLALGASFVGASASNIIATALQVMLKTDQNCLVYIDQGPDGINWDVTDQYNFYDTLANFAMTVNAVGAFYRIRVTNIDNDGAATSYFRLQTIIVPILSTLPRSLDADGNLQVGVKSFTDDSGFMEYLTPFGEQVSVPLYRLIGSVFNGNVLDSNFWTTSIGTGGSVSVTDGFLTMSTGTIANNVTSLRTNRIARYVAGQSNEFRAVVRIADTGTANNTRRGGLYTATDGVFYELSGTTFSLVTRKNSVDTKVVNGTFNGLRGDDILLDTNFHVWEIIVTSAKVYWFMDSVLINTTVATTTSLVGTLGLPIMFENFNTGGSTSNVSMNILSSEVLKMGIPTTQPVYKHIAGAQTLTLKNGAGNLHAVTINAPAGTSITLYDSLTVVAGTEIAIIDPNQITTLDFKGIQFSVGLTVVTAGGPTDCTVLYE